MCRAIASLGEDSNRDADTHLWRRSTERNKPMQKLYTHTFLAALTLATVASPALAGETWQEKQQRIAAEENLDTTATSSIPGQDCNPASPQTSLVCRVTDGQPGVKFPSAPFLITSGF